MKTTSSQLILYCSYYKNLMSLCAQLEVLLLLTCRTNTHTHTHTHTTHYTNIK